MTYWVMLANRKHHRASLGHPKFFNMVFRERERDVKEHYSIAVNYVLGSDFGLVNIVWTF